MVQQEGIFPTQRIYVASSWRNTVQPTVVRALRTAGYEVYDFRDPTNDGAKGFAWSDIELLEPFAADGGAGTNRWDHNYCSAPVYLEALNSPLAVRGFNRDYHAMSAADIFVMVLPCERDAHLELGWAVGAGKQTHILLDNPCKASLMYRLVDFIHPTLDDLLVTLGDSD